MKQTIQGVIFDWAGTTVDFGCFAPVSAFVEAFRKAGIDVTLEETRAPMGKLKIEHIRTMLAMPAVKARWTERWGRSPEESDAQSIYHDFEPALFAVLDRHCELKDGVLDCVKELRSRGLKIGSTTGYTREMMNVVEEAARQAGYAPDCLVTADETGGFGRPWPYMIFENMRLLKLPAVRTVVKIGDTVSDIEEARAAGVWAVGVVDGSSVMGLSHAEFSALTDAEKAAARIRARSVLLAAGADFVIESLSELPGLIDGINARQCR